MLPNWGPGAADLGSNRRHQHQREPSRRSFRRLNFATLDAKAILAAVVEADLPPFQLAAAFLHLSKKKPLPQLGSLEGLLATLVKAAPQLNARDVATAMTACARFKPLAAHPHSFPTLWTSWTTLCYEAAQQAPQFSVLEMFCALN